MREYELMVVYDLRVMEAGGPDASVNALGGLVEARGGKMLKVDHWGRRRMAYPINRTVDADYIVARLELEPSGVSGLEAQLRIDEQVFRHLIVRADELPIPPPPRESRMPRPEAMAPPSAPVPAPEAAEPVAESAPPPVAEAATTEAEPAPAESLAEVPLAVPAVEPEPEVPAPPTAEAADSVPEPGETETPPVARAPRAPRAPKVAAAAPANDSPASAENEPA